MNSIKERLNLNKGDFILGLLGILFGAYIVFVAVPNTVRLPGNIRFFYQRPDVLPYTTGILIALFSALIFFQALLGKETKEEQKPVDACNEESEEISPKDLMLSVGLLIFCIFLYISFLPTLGYLVTSIIFLGCVLLICGYRNILFLLLISVGVPIALSTFFERFLYVFLP